MFWNDEFWKLLGISFAFTLIAHLKVHEEVFKHSCFERIYIEGCIWKFLWSFNGEVWNNRRFCPLLLKLWQKRLNLNIIIRTKGHFYYFECFIIRQSLQCQRTRGGGCTRRIPPIIFSPDLVSRHASGTQRTNAYNSSLKSSVQRTHVRWLNTRKLKCFTC